MRWLLLKDLQLLRRSPLLTGLLIVYPVAIALMIGLAVSSPPGKPKVAIYSGVVRGHGKLSFGSQKIDVGQYANKLYASVDPIFVHSPAAAVEAVRDGRALGALIVPRDITAQIDDLIRSGIGNPTVRLVLNDRDPLERALVNQAIDTRIDQVEGAVSRQVLKVAVADLQKVLSGGTISALGTSASLLGLRKTEAIADGAAAALPRSSPLVAELHRVERFAQLSVEGLAFAGPALDGLQTPLTVQRSQLAGRTTPASTYAIGITITVSLMFVALLLGAAMLALERSENAYRRLVRGLVSRETLLGEKALLAGGCAAAMALVLTAIVSAFVPLEWGRVELWVLTIGLGGVAFGALGVAVGALAREVSGASLLAFGVALPVAFLALIPRDAVSSVVGTLLAVVSFVFPFRPALNAISAAVSGTGGGLLGDCGHLLLLTVVFGALARLALRRFADA
jgi:ABC-type multidrug transport system permease subunit